MGTLSIFAYQEVPFSTKVFSERSIADCISSAAVVEVDEHIAPDFPIPGCDQPTTANHHPSRSRCRSSWSWGRGRGGAHRLWELVTRRIHGRCAPRRERSKPQRERSNSENTSSVCQRSCRNSTATSILGGTCSKK